MFWSFPLVDAYGNSKEDTVLKIMLTKETLDKINFEQFDKDNFSVIADEFYQHPALRK